jgi:hypothetical protein
MRVTAEFLYDQSRILLRLLGTVSPPTNVQVGTYIVSFFATRKPLEFDIDADQIVNNEVNLYLANTTPSPKQITVTLPDLSQQVAFVQLVKKPPVENIIPEQPLETITPREPEPHNPSELKPLPPDSMSQPAYPPYWVELAFNRANPLLVGAGLDSDLATLSYTGGGAGRVLSPRVVQEAANQAPYTVHAPTFLEGTFSNLLPYSDFSTSYTPPGFLDPVPTGWIINQSDPDSLIRVVINAASVTPNFQVVWFLRPNYQDYTLSPPITFITPPVPTNGVVQVMLEPAVTNSVGTAQLVSFTGLYTSTSVVLNGATFLYLNVQNDPGPVRIVWQQSSGNSATQYLSVGVPIVSNYSGPHTWINYPNTSLADQVTVSNLTFDGRWNFNAGFIRIASEQETPAQPLSWSITFNLTGQILLQVVGGILSSDFSTSTVDLRPLLPTDPATMGSYKLSWMAGQNLKLITSVPEQAPVTTTLAFLFNIVIPTPLLTDTININFSSYTPTAGSSRIKYFAFKPAST